MSEERAPQVLAHLGTWPTERIGTVDAPIIREPQDKVPAPTDETPHGCWDGWVYLGFEGEDENGEHVEELERVPCRRCHGEARQPQSNQPCTHHLRGVHLLGNGCRSFQARGLAELPPPQREEG